MKTVLFGLLAFLLAGPLSAAKRKEVAEVKQSSFAVFRGDVDKAIAAQLCLLKRPLSTKELWKAGVYDAQIEGQFFQRKRGKKISLSFLRDEAYNFAKEKNHHGLVYGVCKGGNMGYILSMPSPSAVLTDQINLNIPVYAASQHCSKVSLDIAPSTDGKIETISPILPVIKLVDIPQGVLSFTCWPKAPEWQGPVLWFLMPIGEGGNIEIPFLSVLSKKLSNYQKITAWINKIREKASVKPVGFSTSFSKNAADLASSLSVIHDRRLLNNLSESMKKQGYLFIGENRVKGVDLHNLLKHLWVSPRHRKLLLNPKATILGLKLKRLKDEIFLVTVFAGELPKPKGSRKL